MNAHDRRVHVSSKDPRHRTPKDLIVALERDHFNFVIDAAATLDDRIAPARHYFGPDQIDKSLRDARVVNWAKYFRSFYSRAPYAIWLNPPWSKEEGIKIEPFIERAYVTGTVKGITTVSLLPANIQTRWWQQYVHNKAHEVRFFPHRISFDAADGSKQPNALFNSALVVWRSLNGYSRFRTNYQFWSYR